MAVTDFVGPAMDLVKEAVSFDETEDYQKAYNKYLQAAEHFIVAIKHEKIAKRKEMLKGKLEEVVSRAEQLKSFLNKKGDGKKKKRGTATSGGGDNDDANGDDGAFRTALESVIIQEVPDVKWDDVAGLETAKDALREAVILPIRFPSLFTGKRTPWRGILLYGPPGTGKTFLAKAVATEASATFFAVSSADLVSKWVGESERLVKTLFSMARENKPAIIFIDEIDSLCSSRSDQESESARRIKTEFLIQMQGVGNEGEGVLVLAATNIPWALDAGIRRRFERRLLIPLPDRAARRRLTELHIGNTPHDLDGSDLNLLADGTEGFSGSDISVLVRNALMEPVRTCQLATHFKQVNVKLESGVVLQWTPCSPGDKKAVKKSLLDLSEGELCVPKITKRDFERALRTSRPSVSKDDLAQHDEFTANFGQEG